MGKDFFSGAFPPEYVNSTAGVFDSKIRNGNNERTEFTGCWLVWSRVLSRGLCLKIALLPSWPCIDTTIKAFIYWVDLGTSLFLNTKILLLNLISHFIKAELMLGIDSQIDILISEQTEQGRS